MSCLDVSVVDSTGHEAAARPVNGFEAPALRRSFPVRLVSLSAKLCRRSYKRAGAKIHSFQVSCEYNLLKKFHFLEKTRRLMSIITEMLKLS